MNAPNKKARCSFSLTKSFDEYRIVYLRGCVDIYLEAMARNINIASKSIEDVCSLIREQLPSQEYLKQNLIDRKYLTEEEESLIRDYVNLGYQHMNKRLRRLPDSPAPLNDAIAKFPPLDKDVVIYRYVTTTDFLPEKGKIFVNHGYLSTTLSAMFAFEGVCDDEYHILIRILVPKGSKGLFIPGWESELLFPHKSRLLIEDITDSKVVCVNKKDRTKYFIKNAIVYHAKLLKTRGEG